MSGGSLNYFCYTLEEHVNDLGDKELNDLVKDLATLFHEREWFLSGDTNEGTWNEARDNFKKKWFTQAGRAERIEAYINEFTKEIKQSFGLSNEYCKTCKHWTEDDKPYGWCDLIKECMMHRSETCDKYEGKQNESNSMETNN